MAPHVFRMRVKEDQTERYREEHAHVWPEVRAACTAAGMRNYSIFMAGCDLIAYFEADDPAETLSRLSRDPAMHAWWAYMEPVMDEAPAGSDAYTEVFHLD